jgi:hypothetical protein
MSKKVNKANRDFCDNKIERYRVDYCDEFDGSHFSRCYVSKEEALKECLEFSRQPMSDAFVVDLIEEEKRQCENKFKRIVNTITDEFIQKVYDANTYTSMISDEAQKLNDNIEQIQEKYSYTESPKKKPRKK